MENTKPLTPLDYKKWLKNQHNFDIDYKTESHYTSITHKIKSDFEKSSFWMDFNSDLKEYNDEYYQKNNYQLLMNYNPQLVIKPYDSFLLKSQRKNVINNNNWPNEPHDGWILPNNWYTETNDILRTFIVVKYLDGVDFFLTKLIHLCEKHNITPIYYYQAKMDGYYAAHLYIKYNFEIPKITWDTENVDITIEFQITTQLQEVLRTMLHKYYEEKRKTLQTIEDKNWAWDYKKEEFTANYLGHILHYVEGMIMDIREKQKRDENECH